MRGAVSEGLLSDIGGAGTLIQYQTACCSAGGSAMLPGEIDPAARRAGKEEREPFRKNAEPKMEQATLKDAAVCFAMQRKCDIGPSRRSRKMTPPTYLRGVSLGIFIARTRIVALY